MCEALKKNRASSKMDPVGSCLPHPEALAQWCMAQQSARLVLSHDTGFKIQYVSLARASSKSRRKSSHTQTLLVRLSCLVTRGQCPNMLGGVENGGSLDSGEFRESLPSRTRTHEFEWCLVGPDLMTEPHRQLHSSF